MKTIIQHLRLLCIISILAASNGGRAQSPCTPTLTYSTGLNGSVTFTANPPAPVPPGMLIWTFGPAGFATTTITTQSYTFSSNGVYSVSVTYSVNGASPCSGSTTQTLMVTNATNTGCNLNADFTAVSSFTAGQTYFSNTTTGMNSIATATWNFGDGTSSVGWVPVGIGWNPSNHVYPAAGTYVATLTVSNNSSPACVSTKTVLVNVPYGAPCVANAGFTLTPTGTPQVWNAIPAFPSNITGATWSWGDGSSSNTLYTSHTYSAAGTYSICLTVTVNCGTSNTSCFSYAIYRAANAGQDMNVIQVDVIDPNATVGIKNTALAGFDYVIAPNPGNGLFKVQMDHVATKDVSISVYNVVGRQVMVTQGEITNGSLTKEIDLKSVPEGVYFIQVNSGIQHLTKKVVVQK